jgi:hypothetical protein
MVTPEELEARSTLRTAVVRYDELRTRDSLADSTLAGTTSGEPAVDDERLNRAEALEMLALGEVIARKASYGRQLGVRAARVAGASWSQIGLALGTSKQSAWEAHARWIDEQVEQHQRSGYQGFDDGEAAAARDLAGGAAGDLS